MKQLKALLILMVILALGLIACKKDEESIYTLLLTSKTWGKPLILHRPGNIGMWTLTNCGEYNNFLDNGVFTFKDECTGNMKEGKWSWTDNGQELLIDYQGTLPSSNNKRLIILELSDTLLHTYEMNYLVTDTSEGYWEKKYRPRKK
jgi:hypothetical protein